MMIGQEFILKDKSNSNQILFKRLKQRFNYNVLKLTKVNFLNVF